MAPRATPQDTAEEGTPPECCSAVPAWVIRVKDDELGGASPENGFVVTCCAPQGTFLNPLLYYLITHLNPMHQPLNAIKCFYL